MLSFIGIVPQNEPPSGMTETEKKDWEKKEKEARKEKRYQTHEAASYWYKIVSIDPDFNIPDKEIYVGPDAAEHMLDELTKDSDAIFKQYIQTPKPMTPLTPAEEQKFKTSTECHICGGKFSKTKGGKKVKDHCHILGKWVLVFITLFCEL